MKKLMCVVSLAMVMCFLLAGCGTSENEVVADNEPVEVEETAEPEVVEETPEEPKIEVQALIDYGSVLPDWSLTFTSGNSQIVRFTTDEYYIRISDSDYSQYESFIESCVEFGFTDIKNNMDYDNGQHGFEAYTSDGSYKIGVYFYTDENSNPTFIDIICKYKAE